MKKVAVLLYPQFSNYECSVALSILAQAEKPFDTFALSKAPVRSEEGLCVMPDLVLEDLDNAAYDALLLPGCLDAKWFLEEDSYPQDVARYLSFVRRFDPALQHIAAISSAPSLLAKAGLLGERKFMIGMPPEAIEFLGFFKPENIVEATRANPCLLDDNILTGVGSGFVQFGLQFGEMLGLAFDPRWYR